MSQDNLKEEYEKICQEVLKEDHLRFCGLISGKGELMTGGFRVGITPLENDEEQKKMFQLLKFSGSTGIILFISLPNMARSIIRTAF